MEAVVAWVGALLLAIASKVLPEWIKEKLGIGVRGTEATQAPEATEAPEAIEAPDPDQTDSSDASEEVIHKTSGSIEVTVPSKLRPRSIKVKVLPVPIHGDMKMSWELFSEGIRSIQKQVAKDTRIQSPDLIVGINGAGTMAAAYIDGDQNRRSDPFLVFKTDSKEDQNERPFYAPPLPEIEEIQRFTRRVRERRNALTLKILVVDGQFKSGESVSLIVDHLKTEYRKKLTKYVMKKRRQTDATKVDVVVYLAVLAACGLRRQAGTLNGATMDENGLFHRTRWQHAVYTFEDGSHCFPACLAFVSEGVARPPRGIT